MNTENNFGAVERGGASEGYAWLTARFDALEDTLAIMARELIRIEDRMGRIEKALNIEAHESE
jgi:hypothetical protein